MSLDDTLLRLLSDNLPLGEAIYTLGSQQPNWIARIAPEGIYVETERSRDRGADPERVPAEMLTKGWERLLFGAYSHTRNSLPPTTST